LQAKELIGAESGQSICLTVIIDEFNFKCFRGMNMDNSAYLAGSEMLGREVADKSNKVEFLDRQRSHN
jgi:hypothetical protein